MIGSWDEFNKIDTAVCRKWNSDEM